MNTTNTITVEDLKRFCCDSKEPYRAAIARPFSQGDWTYATDGRVLIRVPRLDEVPEYDDSTRGVEKTIFDEEPITGWWMAIPSAMLPELMPAEKCSECGGDGMLDNPKSECWQCDGHGVIEPSAIPVKIGKHAVSHIYLHKLKTLPGVQICESAKGEMNVLGVRFDGGEGRQMPMRQSGRVDY